MHGEASMSKTSFPIKIIGVLLKGYLLGLVLTLALLFISLDPDAIPLKNQLLFSFITLTIGLLALTLPFQLGFTRKLVVALNRYAQTGSTIAPASDQEPEQTPDSASLSRVPRTAGLLHFFTQLLGLLLLCGYSFSALDFSIEQTGMVLFASLGGAYFSSLVIYLSLDIYCMSGVTRSGLVLKETHSLNPVQEKRQTGSFFGRSIFLVILPILFAYLSLYFPLTALTGKGASMHALLYKFSGLVIPNLAAVLIILWTDNRKTALVMQQIRQFLKDFASDGEDAQPAHFKSVPEGLSAITHFTQGYLSQFTVLDSKIRHLSKVLVNLTSNLTSSAEEIIETSNQQSVAVKEIVTTIESSNQLSKDIQTKSDNVHLLASQNKANVDKGLALLEANIRQMEEIKRTNTNLIFDIQALGEQMVNIGEIVTIINKIAHQTNIIAFNAELQATGSKNMSRSAGEFAAKEAGRNFEIVAAEIRRLVDNTVTATTDIKTKIKEIQQSTKKLTKTFEYETNQINEGWELAAKLKKVFDDIRSSSDSSAVASETIEASIDEQALLIEQVLVTLRQISEGIDSFVMATNSSQEAADLLKSMAYELNGMLEKMSHKGA